MIYKCCAIHDAKAEAWMTPMFFQAAGQAVRSFADAVNDGKSEFSRHPEDFSLFEIGEFDLRTGIFVAESAPVVLASGVNLVQQ